MAPKRETALEAWGKELGHVCDAAGMTAKQLAKAMNVAPSTISQWMNGKRTPHFEDVKRCDTALGTNGFLARYYERWVTREIPSEWDDAWLAAEAQANLIQNFELSVIPGLLQTPDYARAIMRFARHSPLDIEERIRRRIERQKVLNDENPPMCIFVIDEYVLRRLVGGSDVMIEQLTYLCECADQSSIVVKVVPAGTEYYSALPFMIAELDSAKIVNVDDTLSGRVIEVNGEVVEASRIWEDVREAALSPKDSIELIEKVIEEWRI
jgi:transcriptional regulator with XRE-family HTH domain